MTQVPAERAVAGPPRATSAFDLAWMAVLFVAVLALAFRMNGDSPRIWEDTLIENGFLADCLYNNSCSTIGQGATVGIFHSAGYFHVRSLLKWLGSDADHTFRLFLAMGAMGVVLVALTAKRVGGLLAAGVASVLMWELMIRRMQFDAITDVAPVPFLGAVFLALAWVAAARPSLLLSALLGLVCAVMADTYAPTVSCVVSAVWISLRHPTKRWRHVGVALAAFAIPMMVIAPGGWIVSVREMLTHHLRGNFQPVNPRSFWEVGALVATALATGIWGWASLTRRMVLRRQLDVCAAIFVPACIGLLAGDVTKFVSGQEKYAAHVIGAVAVGLAVPAAAVLERLWPATARLRQGRPLYFAIGGVALVWFLCGGRIYSMALDVGANLDSDTDVARAAPWMTSHDFEEAQRVLRERAWSWPDVMRNLKVTDWITFPATYEWARDWPDVTPVKGLHRAYFVKVAANLVPNPLPPNVVVIDSTRGAATLLVFSCSWIDWSAFRACLRDSPDAPEHCESTALPWRTDMRALYWPKVPGMPDEDLREMTSRVMTLHFPLKPDPACPAEAVWTPSKDDVWFELGAGICPGTIVSVDGVVAGGKSSVTLNASDHPSELVMQWPVGSPECIMAYHGWPPFFAEGDPATVAFLKTLLTRREGVE